MIRTHQIPCQLPVELADALNLESGRIYTQVMVEHYRIWRKHGLWLSQKTAEKLNDAYNRDVPRLLHAHSIDAAQQGFYEACKTARATREEGGKYPHWTKRYRSTTWKNTGVRRKDGQLLLALARGREPITVKLPEAMLEQLTAAQGIQQVELVYHKASRRYVWHITVEDGQSAPTPAGSVVIAGDLGEVHPCALSDGQETVVIACRELRAAKQYTHKRLAELSARQARCVKGSRNWWRLQQRKNRFLAHQEAHVRDIEHKVSHTVVQVAREKDAAQIVLGDVRDVADGKRLNKQSQQKISTWGHGRLRRFIGYKAAALGIGVDDHVCEAKTSKTCPNCGHEHKPHGRTYVCTNPECGLVAHRDGVGAVNILSRHLHKAVAKIRMPLGIKYRYPIMSGKRSPSDTGQMARRAGPSPARENRRNRSGKVTQLEAARL